MKKLYALFLFIAIPSFIYFAQAQVMTFSFTGSDGDETNWPSASEAAGLQQSSISRGPGVSSAANADRFNSKNWTTGTTLDLNDYIQVIITPKPGYSLSITSIQLQHQRSLTGPKTFVMRTSFDDFGADATNVVTVPDVNTNQSSIFTLLSPITTQAPLTVRIYGYNAEGATGTWGPGESPDGNDILISGSLVILPIKLVNVKAALKNKQVEVSWSNATESDMLYYYVERSADGRTFSELARTNASKNNGGMADYKVLDLQPLSKTNYYRIKAVEANGYVLYSKIVKIEMASSSSALSVYPNPAARGSQVMLQLSNLEMGNYKLRIYNAAAQLVHQQTIIVNGTSVTQSLLMKEWQKGMYIIDIAEAGFQQKLMVQ